MVEAATAPELIEPVWEKQPAESAVAYAAFRAYRDLHEGRTIDKALEVLLEKWPDIVERDPRSKKSVTSYRGRAAHWSAHNRWVERAAAWDAYIDGIRLEGQELGMRDMTRQLEARMEFVRTMEWEIGSAAYRALLTAMQMPPMGEASTVDGKTINIHPNPTFFKILPGLLREASRMIRLSAGMPTEGAKMPTPPLDTSADSDVEQFFKKLAAGDDGAPTPEDTGEPS